jgi:murein DD-endopeptidase MepM/ murein hydrolase activator NlpD
MMTERFLPRFLLILFILLVLGGPVGIGILRVSGLPNIQIEPAVPIIGKRTPVQVTVTQSGRGLSHVRLELVQGEQVITLAEKGYAVPSAISFWGHPSTKDELSVVVGRETMPGLRAGQAVIRVVVERAGTWLRHPDPVKQEVTLPVHLTPPSLQIMSAQTYVAQGGCEAVVYRVGDTAVRDGVRSGARWFPGYPLPGGGKQDRFAVFAVPYDMSEAQVKLIAADGTGNEAERSFVDKFFPKPIKTDTIEITDSFLNKVVPEILSQSPEIQDRGSLLDNFLAINNDLRKIDGDILKDLAGKSQSEFLWSQSFQMLANGKVMSAFADRRTYVYQNRVIDHQDHLGFDLAVTRQAPVTAANSGVVILAKYFGIFGNSVVIDHGYGLMSLYGHLSAISVKEGDKITRGDVLGNTGETGLAGGDHLHFTMLLQGLPVNPVEWWDSHWIGDRIAKKLGSAFHFSPT